MSAMHELDTLLTGLLDGTLSAADHARLAELITADDAALDRYLSVTETDALLEDELAPAVEAAAQRMIAGRIEPRHAPASTGEPSRWGYVAAAAAVVAATLTGLYAWRNDDVGSSERSHRPIAVMLDATDSDWTTEPREAGDELSPQAIGLSRGRIEMQTLSGATLKAAGPVRMTIQTPDSARLETGRIVARAATGSIGFTVHAPGGLDVVDLGTEFGVEAAEGRVAVTVYEGVVEMRIGDRRHRITAGHGAIYDEESGAFVTDDALNERFADLRPYRLDLINGDFETGDLTGWTSSLTDINTAAEGLSVLGSGVGGINRIPAGQQRRHATRLGYKFQGASLRQQTPHRIAPGATYSVAVRAAASDVDGAARFTEPLQIIAHVGGVNVHTETVQTDGRWRWYIANVKAQDLASAAGKLLEIRLYKAPHKEGDFIWIDDVQLWRGDVTEQMLDMESEIKPLSPSSEGDTP